MAPEPRPIIRPGLIVCEGDDDERLLVTMLNYLKIESIWIERVDGESMFRKYIRILRARPGFAGLRALAVVGTLTLMQSGSLS